MLKYNIRILSLFFCLMAFAPAWEAFGQTSGQMLNLVPGSRGDRVRYAQNRLHTLGYLRCKPTGYYGSLTVEAVKVFQLENGLEPDGIIGVKTESALSKMSVYRNQTLEHTVEQGETLEMIAEKYHTSRELIMARNNLPANQVTIGQKLQIPRSTGNVASRGGIGGVRAIPWSIVDQLWRQGETARIIDPQTGETFMTQRLGGYFHADVEPLTEEHANTFRKINGGNWSWKRRPVVVQIRNIYIAASMNGMPHGAKSIPNNNFPGHFCIHFLGSRIHGTGRVDPDHQETVIQSATLGITPE